MPEVLDRFTAEHFAVNSITLDRQRRVLRQLRFYQQFLGKPLEQGTDEDVRAWLVSLLARGLAPSSATSYMKMVRSFYHWCWTVRLIDTDTWLRILEVKPPRGYDTKAPRPYSRKELTRMWAQLDARFPHADPARVERFYQGRARLRGDLRRHAMRVQLDAIIELALVCGLRRNEIYCLSADDVHPDNAYIVVHGKRSDQNDKVREVPYPDSTREAIRAWFKLRAKLAPEPGLKLWLAVTGANPAAELSPGRMAEILHGFGPWTLHRLRHTCATERLRAGMKIQDLQQFLGHSNINMTLRYAQLVREDIHKASARIDADFQRAIKRRAA